jgi:hypothetical protein
MVTDPISSVMKVILAIFLPSGGCNAGKFARISATVDF